MSRPHPLCLPYAAPEFVERIRAGRIKILGVFRLDEKRKKWHEHKGIKPSYAFITVYRENRAKRGKPKWSIDHDAIVSIADCSCTRYLDCPLALAMEYASETLFCNAVSVERVPTLSAKKPVKRKK